MNDLLRKRYFGQLLRSISLKRTTIGLNRSNNLKLRAPLKNIASELKTLILGQAPRSLSENYDLLRKRSFGQLLRSISLKKNDYSPQLIEISDSKSHILATTLVLGQAPSAGT